MDSNIGVQTNLCSKSDSRHKSNVQKHISFEVLMPQKTSFYIHPVARVEHVASLIEEYKYLFYVEINPPPPRGFEGSGITNLS